MDLASRKMTVIGTVDPQTIRKDLKFQFIHNVPQDVANEAQAASTMNGIVSKETQLSTLSFVDDPKAEMQRMQQEQADQVKQAVQNQASAIDAVKGGNDEQGTNQQSPVLGQAPQARGTLDQAESSQR